MRKEYLGRIPKEWTDVSSVFVALGDEHRQRIMLSFEVGERLNVSEIVAVSTLSRTAVSHHLRVLREAGVLESEKVGKEVFFWVNKKHMTTVLQRVLNYVEKNT
ncbi:MAG: metalloregulator ArsR/SmtB family transcription factor [Rhodocyclaceae bacterium]